MTKFISYDNLSFFFSKLKTIFSNIGHTHTVDDVANLSNTINNIQSDVDAIEQTVANLAENMNPESSFSVETWTFTLVDGTTVSKQVVVK